MTAKFWMIKGSLGGPVVAYHDKSTALARMEAVAQESGQPAYLLEATAVALPERAAIRKITIEELT